MRGVALNGNARNKKAGSDLMAPHGTLLVARCARLGATKRLGRSHISCADGQWSHRLPTCLATAPSRSNFSGRNQSHLHDHPSEQGTNLTERISFGGSTRNN